MYNVCKLEMPNHNTISSYVVTELLQEFMLLLYLVHYKIEKSMIMLYAFSLMETEYISFKYEKHKYFKIEYCSYNCDNIVDHVIAME